MLKSANKRSYTDDLSLNQASKKVRSGAKLTRTSNGGIPLETETPWSEFCEGDSFFSEVLTPGQRIPQVLDDSYEEVDDENDINFNELNVNIGAQEEDDDEQQVEVGIQCTQRFFDDIQFKQPLPVVHLPKPNDSFNIATCFGSQYHFREDIHNHSINESVSQDLSQLNWETFHEEFAQFPSKGPFYGLPDKVEKLIYSHKGISSLYDWQKECLNLPAVHKRKNLIYALPTSGGKTLVAEILMLREIICRQKNVLFILPYVSIVQEKVSAMSPFALSLDFLVDEYTAGKGRCPPTKRRKHKSIFIASIEKGAVLFDSLIESSRADEIGLVVIDEMHLIGEKGRGSTLETFLTKVMYMKAGIQIVGMSATIGNIEEISEFLDADIYTRNFRPVELREYIKCGNDILEVKNDRISIEDRFVPCRVVNYKYSASVLKADPDHLAGLVSEVIPKDSCLIFCSTKKNCENVAILLSNLLPKQKYLEHRKREKADLMDALDKICGTLSPVLKQTIPFGIAYHHSGLTTDERRNLEYAYRLGVICVICCTSTLAAGVNLPAKRVIIRAPYVARNFMNLCQYKQMIGRAGRAGMGEAGESILICSSKDNSQVADMLTSPMNKVMSSMNYDNAIGMQTLILSAIGLQIANCRKDLIVLAKSTLLAIQCIELDVSVDELVKLILKRMHHYDVWQFLNANSAFNLSIFPLSQNASLANTSELRSKLALCNTTQIKLTQIGRAAFKAGIDYRRAKSVSNELKTAQKSLVLTNYSHLLYLLISFNSNSTGDDLVPADPSILFREYGKIEDGTKQLAKVVGITEAHLVRMIKQMSTKGSVEVQLNRFYKVLIMTDILAIQPLHNVAAKYNIDRGIVQNLTNQCVSAASAINRLCEQIDDFWCFRPLFEKISDKLDRCGTIELEPLLELPAVKINRARQLYAAGFMTIEDIAKVKPIVLSKSIEHLSFRLAGIGCSTKTYYFNPQNRISAPMTYIISEISLKSSFYPLYKVCVFVSIL